MKLELTPGQIRYRKYRDYYLRYAAYYREKQKNVPKKLYFERFGGNREKAIIRDEEKCVLCGISREQHKKTFGRDITVDHVNGKGRRTPKNERDNRLENLQTLCMVCHGKKDFERRKNYPRKYRTRRYILTREGK